MQEPEDVVFKAGTILHYKGMPFRAPVEIVLQGAIANKEAADRDFPDAGEMGSVGSASST